STACRRSPCRSCWRSGGNESMVRRTKSSFGRRRRSCCTKRSQPYRPPAPATKSRMTAYRFTVSGVPLCADPSGALYRADTETLAVADLHLGKGAAFAARGMPLPPYDTRRTLERLAAVVARYAPRRVVCLGDSFDTGESAAVLDPADRARL